MRDLDRGIVWPTQSNRNGVYNLPTLPLGNYAVSVEAKGFPNAVNPNVKLDIGQIARVDIKMQFGKLSTMIEVNSVAPQLQTENATVGNVMEGKEVGNMPLATRNYNELTLLTPGAVAPGGLFQYRVFAKTHGHDFVVVDASQPLQAGSAIRLVVKPIVNGRLAVLGSRGKQLFGKPVLAKEQYAITPRKGETALHIVFTPAVPSVQAHAAGKTTNAHAPMNPKNAAETTPTPVTADIHLIYR